MENHMRVLFFFSSQHFCKTSKRNVHHFILKQENQLASFGASSFSRSFYRTCTAFRFAKNNNAIIHGWTDRFNRQSGCTQCCTYLGISFSSNGRHDDDEIILFKKFCYWQEEQGWWVVLLEEHASTSTLMRFWKFAPQLHVHAALHCEKDNKHNTLLFCPPNKPMHACKLTQNDKT